MFDNIGEKIKTLAKVITWLGIIASVIVGLVLMVSNRYTPLPGLMVLILGGLVSWIGSFVLYGFGQLIVNTDKMVALQSGKDVGAVNSGIATASTSDKVATINKWKEEGLITEEEYKQKMESLGQ